MRRAGFVLIAVFWLGYLAQASAYMALDSGEAPKLDLLYRRLAVVSSGVLLCSLAHLFVSGVHGSFTRRARATLAGAVVCWVGFCATSTVVFYVLRPGAEVEPGMAFVTYLVQFAWVFLAWLAAYLALMAIMDLQSEKEHTATAAAQAHQAQLNMLRYQLNPHFLFNTLNAISALVLDRRNSDAEKMLLRLSAFLRHTVEADASHKSLLAREAAMQREYLTIESVRFGDKLRCHCDLPGDLGDCLVPSLLLQPIVENAIKYAIAPAVGAAHLWLGGRAENGRLILYVEDDGPGLSSCAVRRNGVGWANTRARLATMYGSDAEMRILQGTRGRGMLVELDMPLERAGTVEKAVAEQHA